MAIERFKDLAVTTLNGGINNSVTSITVTDATQLPSSALFTINVHVNTAGVITNQELMRVTNVSGNTLTVTRAAGGTTAVSHANGEEVTAVLSSDSMDQIKLDQISVGAYASLPTENKSGRLYVPTDGYGKFINNGSGYLNYGPFGTPLFPPVDANFSWVNQGSAHNIITQGSGLILWGNAQAGTGLNIRAKTLAFSPPYTVTVCLMPCTAMTDNTSFGICLLDNTNKVVEYGTAINSSNVTYQFENYLNSPTSFNSAPGAATRIWPCTPIWLQVRDDGAGTRFFALSSDGFVIYDMFSQSSSGFITPTKVGYYVDPVLQDVIVTCLSFHETTP